LQALQEGLPPPTLGPPIELLNIQGSHDTKSGVAADDHFVLLVSTADQHDYHSNKHLPDWVIELTSAVADAPANVKKPALSPFTESGHACDWIVDARADTNANEPVGSGDTVTL
jgi:hypothetical protein